MTDERLGRWQNYTGPSNWYEIIVPRNWHQSEEGGALHLTAPNSPSKLVIHCGWIADDQSGNIDQLVEKAAVFSTVRRVRRTRIENASYESYLIEGERLRDCGSGGWLKKIIPGNWQRWKIWAVRHRSLLWMIVLTYDGNCDTRAEQVASRILESLSFAATPAEPPEEFAENVLRLARHKFPLLDCNLQGDFQIQLGESCINLFNFYRSYTNAPEKFEQIVLPALTTVVRVQEWGEDQTEPPLDSVRERILPMLYPRSVWEENFPNFVGQEWVADLMILYVVDESNAYWYIRNDLLGRWEIDEDELHELALENLDRYFGDHAMEFTGLGQEDGAMVLMPSRPDAYNSARILSGDFHRKLRELLGREFAVGVPSRDFFVAVNMSSQEVLDHVRDKVSQDFAQMDHPLTERLLLVSADGVSEYVEV